MWGAKIKRFRASKGLSQVQLAVACGFVSYQTIQNYEKAYRRPDGEKAEKFDAWMKENSSSEFVAVV